MCCVILNCVFLPWGPVVLLFYCLASMETLSIHTAAPVSKGDVKLSTGPAPLPFRSRTTRLCPSGACVHAPSTAVQFAPNRVPAPPPGPTAARTPGGEQRAKNVTRNVPGGAAALSEQRDLTVHPSQAKIKVERA